MNDSGSRSLRAYFLTLLAAVGSVALLGAAGFHAFESGVNGNVKSFGDSLWWTMVTMTTIGYGDVFPITTGGRLIALVLMFLGIGTLGVSTAAIAAYFVQGDPLQRLRRGRLRDHVVICGLSRASLLLARAFHQRGQAVVVVERSTENPWVPACRELGVDVLIGDSTDDEVLARARVAEARTLVAMCGDDGANAEVAARARELVGAGGERPRPGHVLTCSTQIENPELWYLLRRWELETVGPFRLQFFNLYDVGARALLDAFPPFERGVQSAEYKVQSEAACNFALCTLHSAPRAAPHLLIVGAGKLAQNVVAHAARLWRDNQAPGSEAGAWSLEPGAASAASLRVTLVDSEAGGLVESLGLHHPGLSDGCEIRAVTADATSPEFQRATFPGDEAGGTPVTAVYVCLEEDARSLAAALALLHRVRGRSVPIVVRMTQEAGLATLLQAGRDCADQLYAVGLLEQICRPELVLGGTNEVLARAIHEEYLREQTAAGATTATNPSLVPWGKLSEDLKESNRHQAGHIGRKLRAIGCDLAPLTAWDAEAMAFTAEEVERMAEMEHDRWAAERRAQGWALGPRDPARKTNPNLVPWPELSEESREFNREAIRRLPASLARAGFRVYRV